MKEQLAALDAQGLVLYYEPSFDGFIVKGKITGGIYIPEISFGKLSNLIHATRDEALQAGIDYLLNE